MPAIDHRRQRPDFSQTNQMPARIGRQRLQQVVLIGEQYSGPFAQHRAAVLEAGFLPGRLMAAQRRGDRCERVAIGSRDRAVGNAGTWVTDLNLAGHGIRPTAQ